MIVTHFEPITARKMMPCFDEPLFKAIFSVRIIRPADFISLSNAEIISSKPFNEKHGLLMDTFAPTVKMSSYLLAIAVCQYERISQKTASGVLVSFLGSVFRIFSDNFVKIFNFFNLYSFFK